MPRLYLEWRTNMKSHSVARSIILGLERSKCSRNILIPEEDNDVNSRGKISEQDISERFTEEYTSKATQRHRFKSCWDYL